MLLYIIVVHFSFAICISNHTLTTTYPTYFHIKDYSISLIFSISTFPPLIIATTLLFSKGTLPANRAAKVTAPDYSAKNLSSINKVFKAILNLLISY